MKQRMNRLTLGVGLLLAAFLGVVMVALVLTYADLVSDLPSIEQLPVLLEPPEGLLLQPTRLYDRSGQRLLATLAPDQTPRTYLPYHQIPQPLIEAVLALADPDFWRHAGYQLKSWRDPSTHPTIAQHLVSDLLLWREEPSFRRAFRERFLAAQVTARYGRQKVLEWYLNSADFGHGAYGVEAAARLYLGKSATQLNLSEAASLAAISQAPALNPFDSPQAAEAERLKTLQAMFLQGKITAEEMFSPPPVFRPREEALSHERTVAPAFVGLALTQLEEHLGRGRIQRGGMEVVTTLDYDLQLQATCALRTQLQRAAGHLSEVPAAEGSSCIAARWLPTLPLEGATLADISASALILDPRSGQILAVVGDTTAEREGSYLLPHPPGTLFMPFLYLIAFSRGWSPASVGWDVPSTVANFNGKYVGPVRLRLALANDYLPPAVTLFQQLGEEQLRRGLISFGLEMPPGFNLFSDEMSLSPLSLVSAYAVLANQGMRTGQVLMGEASSGLMPSSVLQVRGVDQFAWLNWNTPEVQAVVSPQLAYLINHVLSDESARRPSLGHPNPLEIDRPVAAKIGRTFRKNGLWVVGYTPQRLVLVWMGKVAASAEEARSLESLGLGLWQALMRYALLEQSPESWAVPNGIVKIEVCDPSGMLPSEACPIVVREVFISGNEPVHVDTLYQSFEINRETGLLATVFTPPELVEERVYLVPPPEVRAWVESVGIPLPPSSYDLAPIPTPHPEVHITSPPLFSDVKGRIAVIGTASGPDFSYYRLEYGSGLKPKQWFQLGQDVSHPVVEGLLAEWDTRELNGLYALRLFVARTDGRLERAVWQVTIDNIPPKVDILYPWQGQTLTGGQVRLQAQVNDSYLNEVKFSLDGKIIREFSSPPFDVVWQVEPGIHVFQVEAVDRAGNVTTSRVQFRVKR